jgi:hypothetical protein
LTGEGLSYGEIFSIIDGTNCNPKAVLACRSVNLVFISFSVQYFVVSSTLFNLTRADLFFDCCGVQLLRIQFNHGF